MTEEAFYTLPQAAKQLPITQRMLYQWVEDDLLTIDQHEQYSPHYRKNIFVKGLTETSLNELKAYLTIPDDCIEQKEFLVKNDLSQPMFRKIINQLGIKPYRLMTKCSIGLTKKYYRGADLDKVHQYLYQQNQANGRFEVLKPTTDQLYRPGIDYTPRQLGLAMNHQKPYSYKSFQQGIKSGRFAGKYEVDINGKLFFTPEQAEYYKQNYRKLPNDVYGTCVKLATECNVRPAIISKAIKELNIKTTLVIGYHGAFLTNTDAKRIRQYLNVK